MGLPAYGEGKKEINRLLMDKIIGCRHYERITYGRGPVGCQQCLRVAHGGLATHRTACRGV